MQKAALDKAIETFEFECTDPAIRSFGDLKDKNIVLYFYPKDNTPGCTTEGRDFTALQDQFRDQNTQILGISRDSLESHHKFCAKQAFTFPLISDKEEILCNYFDVMIKKNMFKKLILGIDRSTFLIDAQGILRKAWRNVKVKDHANEVLAAVKEINT